MMDESKKSRKKNKLQQKRSSMPIKDDNTVIGKLNNIGNINLGVNEKLLKGVSENLMRGVQKNKEFNDKEFSLFSIRRNSNKDIEASTINFTTELGIGSGDFYELDGLDLMAVHIIDYIMGGSIEFAQVSTIEQNILFRYFYRHNPVLGRIIDLHVNLPLSKIRLQSPRNVPEIVSDFITQFYNKIMENTNFLEVLRKAIRDRFLYGSAYIFVDDYYNGNKELQPVSKYGDHPVTLDEDSIKYVNEIEALYSKDPSSLGLQDRINYLNVKFFGNIEHNYKGPISVRTIDFWEIQEVIENKDVQYHGLKLLTPDSLKVSLNDARGCPEGISSYLNDIGYSNGMRALLSLNEDLGFNISSDLYVDNDTYSGVPFVLYFEGESIVRRVIMECLEWEMAKRAFIQKIKRMGKIGRVITSDQLSEDQLSILQSQVKELIEDGDQTIVANFPISWEEVESFVKEELNELRGATDNLIQEFSIGLGMPDSLIRGESSYSGDTIKLEILNTEYLSLKIVIQNLINSCFIKPIALRKGLISLDSWGDSVLVAPKLTFSRVALRDDSVFDILFQLYQKGSLPVDIIYELLNLDSEDIVRGIKNDLFTPLDPNFNEVLRELYSSSVDKLANSTDVHGRILESLGLKIVTTNTVEGLDAINSID